MAERFAAYFWDGGLDQYLEENFLKQYGMDCDNFCFNSMYCVEVDTNGATD